MTKPGPRQFGALAPGDFARHPVWIGRHGADGDEPRCDETGTQRPQIFADGRRFDFWGGIIGIAAAERQALYAAPKKTREAIFPLSFGAKAGRVDGFYRRRKSEIEVER